MAYNKGIGGINNVFGINQTQLNPNYGTSDPAGNPVTPYYVQGQVPMQNPRQVPSNQGGRERDLSFMDFSQRMNQYNNLQYPQLNPQYRPNPAFQTGLAFGVNAPLGAKVGTTIDLLTQSLFNLNNKLQPFFPQNNPTDQRVTQAKVGDGNMSAPTRTTRGNQAQATYKDGGKYPMYQDGGQFGPDPTQLYPNQFDLKPNPYWGQTPQQPLSSQPPTNFVDQNYLVQDYSIPTQGEPNRAVREDNNMGAANIVGASAAGLSFGLDLGKNIAAGIGVGRRSQYAMERAQERMRDATIQQGYEDGRESLFNQGYLQTTNYMAQDGGKIPVSLDGLNQFPKQPVIVPSNNITMQGIPYDVMAYPNNDAPQLMKPDQNYQFPNSTQVLEQPMMKDGGMIELEKGIYFNPTTQEFIYQ